jgi:hypothetical protein
MPCTSRTNSTTRRRAYATRSSLGLRKSSAARWQNAARVESSAFGEEAIAEIEKGACELRVPAHAGGGRGNVRQGLWVSSRRASGRWKLRGVGSKRVIRGRLVEGIVCDAGLWRSHPVRWVPEELLAIRHHVVHPLPGAASACRGWPPPRA